MRMLSKLGAVAILSLFWALPASANCAMCSAYGGCYIIAADGFRNCTENSCSGNCRYTGGGWDCPEIDCFSAIVPGVGEEKSGSASTCGSPTSAKVMKSERSAREVFAMSESDPLLSQAILTFERAMGTSGLSDKGAFAFALPHTTQQLDAVLNGGQLRFTPFRVPATGFADYTITTGANGQLDVTLRIWEVSMPGGKPVDGLTVFLQYDSVANSMRLANMNKLLVMPTPVAEYFYNTSVGPVGRDVLTPDRDTRL